jgi:hypothetical protein
MVEGGWFDRLNTLTYRTCVSGAYVTMLVMKIDDDRYWELLLRRIGRDPLRYERNIHLTSTNPA